MNNIPRHIAIIMDGNGRWAERQGLPRVKGHQEGLERVEEIIRCAPKYGIEYLTLYAFSKENWQRPPAEVNFLMELLANYLDKKLAELLQNNVRFNVIGRIDDLPAPIQKKIYKGMEDGAANTGTTVTFAFSYSSRLEITDACQKIAEKVLRGDLKLADIDEQCVQSYLYTHNLPDPDLLVRTSGEMRISNFLLWQLSYSEIYITEKFWPEFTEEEFVKAIRDYQKRDRRFGKTKAEIS